MVLLQSKTLTVTDPAFRAAIADAVKTFGTFPEVQKLESPLEPGHSGLVSKDGHSAMIQFTPKGTYEEAILYIDTIVAAIDKVEARHPGFTIESVGVSTEKAIDAEIKGGLAKAGLISIPLTIIILLFVLGSLVAALIPLLLGITSVMRHDGSGRALEQGRPRQREHHGGRPARSASPSASTTRSSTCGVNARSGQPVAARAPLSRPPPRRPGGPSSSRA